MPGRSRTGPETVFKWRKERIRKRRSVMHPKNKSDAQIANWLLFRPLMLGQIFPVLPQVEILRLLRGFRPSM